MKRTCLLLILLISKAAFGQSGIWTWISGSATSNTLGVFGTQGIPSINNHPPSLYEPCEWKDKQGNLWLYGGYDNNSFSYSDLWKFDPSTYEWTWVKGTGVKNKPAVYGTKGVANVANTPGCRTLCTVSWTDTSGNFWLFGGANFSFAHLDDLWKYDVSNNKWTWVNGPNASNSWSVHGTKGIAAPSNLPGARSETASAWTDSLNNLWLFGGLGYDENGNYGALNDLFRYNIAADEWTWMKGSAFINAAAQYGVKGVANSSNDPGARWSYTKWKDIDGNFALMGGYYSGTNSASDLWTYNIKSNEWTWLSGPNVTNDTGSYVATCSFKTYNQPIARLEQRSAATDNCGRFWLFGGGFGLLPAPAFSDLWVFDPVLGEWIWLSGSNIKNNVGTYGMFRVPSPANLPPARAGAVAWWGNDNKFYLFGGQLAGNFFSDVWRFDPDTNCFSLCNAVRIPAPVASFQSDTNNICANDCIDFTNISSNATSYHWLFPGGTPSFSTDTNPGVCYLTAGIYNVTLIASGSGGTDTLTIYSAVTVNAAPPIPFINSYPGFGNDTLKFKADTSYRSYQWYLDSTLIPGATDTFLVISVSGNYNVAVTNSKGCRISVGINLILGLQNYMEDNSISLFPNPARDKFTVYGLQFTVGRVDIYNTLGQVVQRSPLLWKGVGGEADVSTLPPGIYFVQLIGEKQRLGVSAVERWTGRFVKE